MSKNKVTIYDVASSLGLSTATVNRVINHKPNVSERTRKLVLKAVEEMGYRPSKTASSLSRTPIHISVLINASISDFHSEIERGAKKALEDLFDFNVRLLE
ncbi:MAG: LacI family DNA-binding transcriptional regulator [Lachnospiraceae bacterium]